MSSLPPSTAWSRFGMIFLGIGFLLVLGMFWLTNHLHDTHQPAKPAVKATPGAGQNPGPTPGKNAVDPPSATTSAKQAAADKAAADQAAVEELGRNLADALAVLRSSVSIDKRATLQALRELLAKADPATAIAAIRQFLASKEDAPTGLRFQVGTNGVLADAPTMRTFLMDQLGTFSRREGTSDAAEVGRETLASKDSADEWAVALRNVGWSDPQGSRPFLAEKARELIRYAPWQALRSGGYLQAFDAAAYSGDASLFDELAPLSKTPSGVQQAAIVAMDRLTAVAPGNVSNYLNAHPDMLADRPMIRADYMGKVDLSDPNQVGQAETYLQRADVTLEEKTKFLGRLGEPAGFVSNTLLTPAQGQVINLPQHQAVVNKAATVWLNSGRYPALQTPLQQLIGNTGPGG